MNYNSLLKLNLGEHFNSSLYFSKLPFFFDNETPNFYRFDAFVYNANYEIAHRNFS